MAIDEVACRAQRAMMETVMRYLVPVLALLAIGAPAAAQSTYVGGSVVFDIARFDKVGYDDDMPRITGTATSVDGEAVGFNLRIGRALGERWGLEFEFARSGQFENQESYGLPLLTDLGILPPELTTILPIPEFQFEIDSEQRYTSYGALAWVRQNLGERVDLTYLGGVMFNHAEIEQDVRLTDPRLIQWVPIPETSVIEYSISPAVGIDTGFKLSDAAAITAGLRLHGVSAGGRTGLLLRPNVGVRWTF